MWMMMMMMIYVDMKYVQALFKSLEIDMFSTIHPAIFSHESIQI